MYNSTHYESRVGDILLAADENNIIGLWIGEQKYIGNTMPKDITEKRDCIIELITQVKRIETVIGVLMF